MLKFLSKRVVQIVILLFIYVTIVFWLMEALPGSFLDKYLMNPKITPEIRENLKRQFGFDKPVFTRYLYYMKNFLVLDLGVSFSYFPRKVTSIIFERLPRTVFLFVTSTLVSYAFGYTLGKRSAWKRGKVVDQLTT
ncbi:MAG TPA: ABC transporter permease, partial [Pseudothermotoga sp.]